MKMTSNNDFDRDVYDLHHAAVLGYWERVLKMYEDNRALRSAKIDLVTGETALHIAVASGTESVVEYMVDIVCGGVNDEEENGDEKNLVLGAEDDEGNTPLHLAVEYGSVKMCEKIVSKADPLLIAKRNNRGETPLFLAAVLGRNKKAFLILHFKYMKSPGLSVTDIAHCIKRDNQDTILHRVLEQERIDWAIEIVLLYKDYLEKITRMHNRSGLSPLHLLAERPSLFESTDLPEQSFIVRLLYHFTFVRVEEKRAPTKDELERVATKKFFRNLVDSIQSYFRDFDVVLEELCWSWAVWIVRKIAFLLFALLIMITLGLPLIAEHWFYKMRDMKEKHTWSLQIIEELLQHALKEDMSANPYEHNVAAGSKIVDTPLMCATKNGVSEVVERILDKFPGTISIVNEEGKDTVLLAAEKRQTHVYQIFYKHSKSGFSQVDKYGNTALHLASVNPNWKATTLDEEIKWFEFVKKSVPNELRDELNNEGKSAEEIFRASYEKQMKNERQWLNQSSQACSVVSSVVASMAFSNVTSNSDQKTHNSSLVALFMSLSSTIILLTILTVRSQSLNFWRYLPFMLQGAIYLMFGSIASLWISLMLRHEKYLITYIILGSIVAVFGIVSTKVVIGPSMKSMFTEVPPPNRSTATSAIRKRRNVRTTSKANDSLQDIRVKRSYTF